MPATRAGWPVVRWTTASRYGLAGGDLCSVYGHRCTRCGVVREHHAGFAIVLRVRRRVRWLRRGGNANGWSPAMREKIVDPRGGVRVNAEQDVTQIREWVDIVQV